MKKTLSLLLAFCATFSLFAQQGGIPNLKGYVTLKCDFHTHTVFSDGLVWPTVRVDEAIREGLDAISLTEHIEYRPHAKDVVASHNRAYEIAKPHADSKNLILIRGSEITRAMPPGHHNAIFLTDSDALDTPDYMDAFRAARAQNAFLFWNHPGWLNQQPDTTRWFDEHTKLMEQGFLQGIEVVNGPDYYPEAHRWCLEKKLTFIGTSDIHQPMFPFAPGKHRAMTLVFAKERSEKAIHEALLERRTAVYYEEFVIGEEKYLKELFENAVEWTVDKTGNVRQSGEEVRITMKNNSELTFHLRGASHDPKLVYLRNTSIVPLIIEPNSTKTFTVRLLEGAKGGDVNFRVENFLVLPNTGMVYTIKL